MILGEGHHHIVVLGHVLYDIGVGDFNSRTVVGDRCYVIAGVGIDSDGSSFAVIHRLGRWNHRSLAGGHRSIDLESANTERHDHIMVFGYIFDYIGIGGFNRHAVVGDGDNAIVRIGIEVDGSGSTIIHFLRRGIDRAARPVNGGVDGKGINGEGHHHIVVFGDIGDGVLGHIRIDYRYDDVVIGYGSHMIASIRMHVDRGITVVGDHLLRRVDHAARTINRGGDERVNCETPGKYRTLAVGVLDVHIPWTRLYACQIEIAGYLVGRNDNDVAGYDIRLPDLCKLYNNTTGEVLPGQIGYGDDLIVASGIGVDRS